MPRVAAAMATEGATHIGATAGVRAPIDIAQGLVEHADELEVDAADWSGGATAGPAWSMALRWPDGSAQAAAAVLARLVDLGSIDLATAHVLTDRASARDRHAYVANPYSYRDFGPAGLGFSTYLGPRFLDLLDAPARAHFERIGRRVGELLQLSLDEDQVCDLSSLLAASGLARTWDGDTPKRGSRWQPPPPASLPSYAAEAERIIDAPQAVRVDDGDAPVMDLRAPGVVVPFARLASTHAENLDLDDGVLAFAELAGARIHDARFGGADLRAVDARGSQWIDVKLVEADLRWANFAQSRLPYTSLDHANCAHVSLTEAALLESAREACFDHCAGARWSAREADLVGASFRHADLRAAIFDGANLERACFDGADLTDASFRDAKLRGASFENAKLAGADMTGAERDGTVPEPATELWR